MSRQIFRFVSSTCRALPAASRLHSNARTLSPSLANGLLDRTSGLSTPFSSSNSFVFSVTSRDLHHSVWYGVEENKGSNEAESTSEKAGPEEGEEVGDEKDKIISEKDAELLEVNDRLLRALAEVENVRGRMSRQLDDSKKFAIQGFVKELLDVADNLQRAASSVPQDLDSQPDLTVEAALEKLKGLKEGVLLTEKQLFQVFGRHGVKKYDSLGEEFDPNLHMALFEMPNPEEKSGIIGNVVKEGYTLHERVVRPAEVGVVKNA